MPLKSSTSTLQNDRQTLSIPAMLRSRRTTAQNVPVVAGLCVPKGRLKNPSGGRIDGLTNLVNAQFEVLNRWHDGSVRWLLTSFIAPEVSGVAKSLNVVAREESNNADTEQLAVEPSGTIIAVKFVGGEIRLQMRDLNSDPPAERTVRLLPRLGDTHGEELALQLDDIRTEVSGSVRQVFLVSLRIQALPSVTLQVRLTHWSTAGLLQVETRIRNTRRAAHKGGLWDLGDSGSFLFRSLELSLHSDEIPANARIHWKARRDSDVRATMSEVFIRQFGSGEKHWSSTNHLSADGTNAVRSRGFEASCESGVLRGYQAEPTLLIEGDGSTMAVAVPEFWQQFPGSVAAAMGSLEVGLFPALPGVTHELQGGEQKTRSFWISTQQNNSDVDHLDWAFDVPRLIQSPTSVRTTHAISWFSGEVLSSELNSQGTLNSELSASTVVGRFANYLHRATAGRFSLDARRASIDEYGWRNFGDVPADHEQTHYAGSNTIVSHYNNQFDMIFGATLQLAATGDLKWFDLLDPLARHVIDIDIYHTNEDRAAFNGGLFWHTDHYVDARLSTHRSYSRRNQKPGHAYGGGPSCEHNYTTGLLHYYFLTGNVEARESVLSLADWVIQMDDGRNTIFGLLDDGPTGAASATVFEDFHGPGRGAGNSVNALLDAWLLTSSDRYISKLEELIRRCVHPQQKPDDLHLLDAEGHWSYTVFLNALGRYLIAKRDAELFDAMYSYARDVMQTYGRWMALYERRTLEHPEELQYPTEAWAAQDFRKANVLRIAASCEDDAGQALAMRMKADQINDAAWRDFAAFGDASLTARCLSIVMTEGHREVFHSYCEPNSIPACPARYETTVWSMFIPQKQRVKTLLKSPAQLARAALKAVQPARVWKACQALRRQL
jgi:hypothetical protein